MSDEKGSLNTNLTIEIRRRMVARDSSDRLYYVMESDPQLGWKQVSKGYAHSTSCYAKLGRITHLDNVKK